LLGKQPLNWSDWGTIRVAGTIEEKNHTTEEEKNKKQIEGLKESPSRASGRAKNSQKSPQRRPRLENRGAERSFEIARTTQGLIKGEEISRTGHDKAERIQKMQLEENENRNIG